MLKANALARKRHVIKPQITTGKAIKLKINGNILFKTLHKLAKKKKTFKANKEK